MLNEFVRHAHHPSKPLYRAVNPSSHLEAHLDLPLPRHPLRLHWRRRHECRPAQAERVAVALVRRHPHPHGLQRLFAAVPRQRSGARLRVDVCRRGRRCGRSHDFQRRASRPRKRGRARLWVAVGEFGGAGGALLVRVRDGGAERDARYGEGGEATSVELRALCACVGPFRRPAGVV